MASKEAQALHDGYRRMQAQMSAGGPPPPLEEIRAQSLASMSVAATVPESVTVGETYAGGVRAYWNDASGGTKDRVLMFMHGGGYSIMSPKSHERLAGHLAKAVGCRVLNIDYRLTPEHTHPAPVDDALAVYRWLLERGYGPGYIAVSGDSAGGGLALATLVAIRDAGLPQPAAAVLFSPWADLDLTGESMVSRLETDLLVNMEQLRFLAASFLGPNGSTRDPLASPLYADFAGLAPIYAQVGGDETLLDDARRVVEKATAVGVEARLDVFPEMQHFLQLSAGNVPEATESVRLAGEWLKPKLELYGPKLPRRLPSMPLYWLNCRLHRLS